MSKEASYYFPHDFGARNDPKLQNILVEHGAQGHGVYWWVVEMMYEQGGKLPLTCIRSISFSMHVDVKIIESIVKDSGLFEYDVDFFWSNSALRRLELIAKKRKQQSEAGKRSAEQRSISNRSTNVDEKSNERSTSVPTSVQPEKEKKEKENKEDESKGNNKTPKPPKGAIDLSFVDPVFLQAFELWLEYKKDKKDAYKSQTSVEMCYRKMLKIAGGDAKTAMEVVENSMANNWKGLFPYSPEKRQSSSNQVLTDQKFIKI